MIQNIEANTCTEEKRERKKGHRSGKREKKKSDNRSHARDEGYCRLAACIDTETEGAGSAVASILTLVCVLLEVNPTLLPNRTCTTSSSTGTTCSASRGGEYLLDRNLLGYKEVQYVVNGKLCATHRFQ